VLIPSTNSFNLAAVKQSVIEKCGIGASLSTVIVPAVIWRFVIALISGTLAPA